MWRPQKAQQMTTHCILQTQTIEDILGTRKKSYSDSFGFNCNWASYGGTETTVNGVIVVEDTAQIITWYNPDIKAGCRIKRAADGAIFEILGEPENIEQRNMFLSFKVRRVKGGA